MISTLLTKIRKTDSSSRFRPYSYKETTGESEN